jgi:hypothetical protein
VDQVLHVGAQAYGFINAAQGLGAVTSAYILARYGNRGTKGKWLYIVALIFPFLLTGFAWSISLPMSLGIVFFHGHLLPGAVCSHQHAAANAGR